VVGTAGHIDHGKTSLVKALTGTDTDRLPEEKARGITIDLGFAFLEEAGDLVIEIVDVPGHERFVRNMLAGAGGIDLALLVVAADEGVMPQTREHLAICQILRIKSGLVVLSKADLAEPDWIELVRDDVRRAVAGTFLAGAPIVPGCPSCRPRSRIWRARCRPRIRIAPRGSRSIGSSRSRASGRWSPAPSWRGASRSTRGSRCTRVACSRRCAACRCTVTRWSARPPGSAPR
jgi:small GTP-binding protein